MGAKKSLFYCSFSIAFILVCGGLSFGASSARFIVSDEIIPAKKEARIEARLLGEKIPFFTRPVSGERVRFLLNKKPLGLSLTGGDGIATHKIPPLPEGLHRVQVELADSSYRALPSEFLLGVWDQSSPLLLVLTSSLMVQTAPTFPIPPLSGPPLPPALPHAAEVLNQLQKKWATVYITGGFPLPYEDQKKWLKTFAFPEAPLIRIKPDNKGVIRQVQDWKDGGWKKIKWVVTDSKEQAEELAREGLSPILIETIKKKNKKDSPSKDAEYFIAEDWKELPGLIQAGKRN